MGSRKSEICRPPYGGYCVLLTHLFVRSIVACFCRAMLCISAAYAVMRCLCVCVSVTFVHCVNKGIFNFFHLRVATPF